MTRGEGRLTLRRPVAPPLLLLLALASVATGCGKSAGEGGEGGASSVPVVVSARTAVAAEEPFGETVAAIGTVTPRPGSFAQLGAPGPTRVARVIAMPGQAVRAGDPLLEFERAPFDAAARSAEAALSTAQNAYDRAVRLAQQGIVPRKEVDQAAGELAQANSAMITARRSQELATLRSPIAGVVTRMTAVLGAPADAGQLVAEVVDPHALEVVLSLSPAEAGLVRVGAAVRTAAGEREGGETLGDGVVTGVAAAVDSVSRAVAVRARLPRPARPLRIGETVFGRIVVARRARAVTVPAEALVPEGDGFKVFVVDSAGIAHARPVVVGGRSGARVEIRQGLAAGETVITYGAYGMEDSARVVRVRP